MQTMYPGKVNSPQTEIAVAITDDANEIELIDASVLPDAPNLAVIMSGEMSETIRYNGKEGNKLTGVERGFQFLAQGWPAGTKVARYFTAYDHDAFMSNIEQHETAISALEDRLDTSDTVDITLQPGLQVVNAAKDARFKLGEIIGKTEINYEGRIGIVGVENPYAIGYGENLLPPFYEWVPATIGNGKHVVQEPYKLYQYSKDLDNYATCSTYVPVIPNETYTLSASLEKYPDTAKDGLFFYWADENKVRLTGEGYETRKYRGTYTAPPNAKYAEFYFVMDVNNDSVEYKTQIVSNPMFVVGTEARPFKPQRKSMLALQTELHANPADGSEPDVLFEREGQYFKLAKWKKIILDRSLNWAFLDGVTDGISKRVSFVNALDIAATNYGFLTKYDGKRLATNVETYGNPDSFAVSSSGATLCIANADSGWGPNYTPTPDEIKAYFMGWRMYDGNSAGNPYNGTGTKSWNSIAHWGTSTYATISLPTTPAPESDNWKPYQLLYRLAKETVEPVPFEGALMLPEGQSVVEVGTGIVLRERANPVQSGVAFVINDINYSSSRLTNMVDRFISVYRNSRKDSTWELRTNNAYGNERRVTFSYDPLTTYSATYIKLDKSPIQPITGTLAANEKAQISDLTAGVAEALQRVSVVEQKKAEKDVPGWITPTLLNGWTNYDLSQYDPVGFYKDDFGQVHLRGMITGGASSPGIVLFRLPLGYRPLKHIAASTVGSSDGDIVGSAVLLVAPNGNVTIMRGSVTGFLSLIIPSFQAQQQAQQ